MIDADAPHSSHIKKEFVTAENINELLEKYLIPASFDLFSLDIDYNTYWIWKAMRNYHPRVIVIEYNSSISYNKSLTVKYEPHAKWDGTNYFGASLLVVSKLGISNGYILVGCDSMGINAFFVKNDLIQEKIRTCDIKDFYRPPKYGLLENGIHIGHTPSNKQMIDV